MKWSLSNFINKTSQANELSVGKILTLKNLDLSRLSQGTNNQTRFEQTRIVAKKSPKKSAVIHVCLVGQKSENILVGILGETMTS